MQRQWYWTPWHPLFHLNPRQLLDLLETVRRNLPCSNRCSFCWCFLGNGWRGWVFIVMMGSFHLSRKNGGFWIAMCDYQRVWSPEGMEHGIWRISKTPVFRNKLQLGSLWGVLVSPIFGRTSNLIVWYPLYSCLAYSCGQCPVYRLFLINYFWYPLKLTIFHS